MISIVIEGKSEAVELGTVRHTLRALQDQDFPLKQVNIILVGEPEQTQDWQQLNELDSFASVQTIGCAGGNYYGYKKIGSTAAEDEITAFIDSDVIPDKGWLSAIAKSIGNGADVSIGLTRFVGFNLRGITGAAILGCSAISWGWVVGKKQGNSYSANGFVANNVAFRSESLKRLKFRTDRGRSCGALFLYSEIKASNMQCTVSSRQRADHYFGWKEFVTINFLAGYELVIARKQNPDLPNGWTSKTGLLEPLICLVWHSIFDVPQSYRYGKLLELSPSRHALLVFMTTVVAIPCRLIQTISMYATMIAKNKMRVWMEHAVC